MKYSVKNNTRLFSFSIFARRRYVNSPLTSQAYPLKSERCVPGCHHYDHIWFIELLPHISRYVSALQVLSQLEDTFYLKVRPVELTSPMHMLLVLLHGMELLFVCAWCFLIIYEVLDNKHRIWFRFDHTHKATPLWPKFLGSLYMTTDHHWLSNVYVCFCVVECFLLGGGVGYFAMLHLYAL